MERIVYILPIIVLVAVGVIIPTVFSFSQAATEGLYVGTLFIGMIYLAEIWDKLLPK